MKSRRSYTWRDGQRDKLNQNPQQELLMRRIQSLIQNFLPVIHPSCRYFEPPPTSPSSSLTLSAPAPALLRVPIPYLHIHQTEHVLKRFHWRYLPLLGVSGSGISLNKQKLITYIYKISTFGLFFGFSLLACVRG